MKKLLFIIPKVLTSSIILRPVSVLLISSILLLITTNLFADAHEYGCRVGNRIFQIYDTVHVSPTNFQMDSDGNTFPNGFAVVDEKCDNGATTTCALYNGENFYATGILADFSVDYCPIDDYVPTLLIFTLVVGLFQFLRPTFPMLR